MQSFEFQPDDCLLIIDVQNDFCDGGSLAVPDGDAVVSVINDLSARAPRVVLTQDWHPAGHSSFASEHADKAPYDVIQMPYGAQTLWPDHCIQGSIGAQFHSQLDTRPASLIVRKGYNRPIDSYSAFFENDHQTPTGLTASLRQFDIKRIVCVGLAYDFCVRFSAEDARREHFDAVVLQSACRGIDLAGSVAAASASMKDSGIDIRA